ncbi:21907_t:CDS:2 [Rhizophagus irregularis]|nr:21907_t:CDS:2 [Rhizophagus irregularis]
MEDLSSNLLRRNAFVAPGRNNTPTKIRRFSYYNSWINDELYINNFDDV